ncbi:MAG: divalent-cation tolerance protein CutA [Thermodesulfobacteriota bacterium]
MDLALVVMTAKDEDEARLVAEKLVGEKLAACVNIIPKVLSVYRWKGEVFREPECYLLAKTRKDLVPRLTAAVRSVHSYECPAVAALDITGGSPDFLAWIADMTE